MLKTPRGPSSDESRPYSIVLFRIGGRPLAIKADEVGGVWPWEAAVPVPSRTACVNGIVRRGNEVLAVFDLAGRLGKRLHGTRLLCLIVKHRDGPMAVCIDEAIPSLKMLEPSLIRPLERGEPDVIGTCHVEDEEVTIYSLAMLNALQRVPKGMA